MAELYYNAKVYVERVIMSRQFWLRMASSAA